MLYSQERSEEWARKLNVERFRWHNLQWLDMVSDNSSVASSDSLISDSPDIYRVIFGAEDILGVASPDIRTAFANNDF